MAVSVRARTTQQLVRIRRGASAAWLAVRVASQSLTDAKVRKRARYARYYRRLALAPDTVVFEATLDDAIRCNPRALFLYMLAQPAFSRHTLVWAIKSPSTIDALRSEYRDSRNVRFVRSGSNAHMRHLASAGHIITNGSLPTFFQRKSGQIVVNTWHGVPIKKMGFEIPNGNIEARNVLRVLAQTDYLLSGSGYETEALYLRGHKLRGIFEGSVLEEGHPRDDLTLDCDRIDHAEWLRTHGVRIGYGKKVVLYAPTWRGSRVQQPVDTVDDLLRVVTVLRERLDPDRYTILVKLHHLTAAHLVDDERFEGMLVPTHLDTNEVLGVVDVLVTDYSSIFVDFLVTGRPVVFFIDDLEEYVAERGVYILPKDLPGPVAATPEETADLISRSDVVLEPFRACYREMRRELCGKEDGHATERVVDVIFNGATGYATRTGLDAGRTKVLLSVGGFGEGHASRSILALLCSIDHARYDVSIFSPFARTRTLTRNLLRIPASVRPFLRVGGSNATALERVRQTFFARFGARRLLGLDGYPRELFRREWERLFGAVGFDIAIDVAGTKPVHAAVLAEGESSRRYFVERDDLSASDLNKQSSVVSISDRFTARLAPEEAPFVRMVDPAIVRADAAECEVESAAGVRVLLVANERDSEPSLPSRTILPPVTERSFVVTERDLAAQKLALVAFSKVLPDHPGITLAFVDAGPGAARIGRAAESLGLAPSVLVVCPPSTLAYVSNCGCFVAPPTGLRVSQDLLEAAALGMPTIVARSEAVDDLFAGTGRLVDANAAAIAAAMDAFLRGALEQGAVDLDAYNAVALAAFERLADGA